MKRMILVSGYEIPEEVLKNMTHQVITNFNSVSIFKEYLEKSLKKQNENLVLFEGGGDYIEGCEINYEKFDKCINQFIEKIKSDDINREFYLLEVYNQVSNNMVDFYLFNSKDEVFDYLARRTSMNYFLLEKNENGHIIFFDKDKDFNSFIDKQIELNKMNKISCKDLRKVKEKVKKNNSFLHRPIFLVEKTNNNEIEYFVFNNEDNAKEALNSKQTQENI